MSKTFCPLPWNSINIRNNGDLRICCNANSYTENRGILRKEDGTPFNASRDDIQQGRNSDVSKDVRLKMLKGEWHSECERCRQEEINGVLSRRQMENNEGWEITAEYAEQNTEQDGTIDTDKHKLEYFDIRYGNFCNLKCRMCGATDSHSWYEDFIHTTGNAKFKDTHQRVELTKNKKGRWETDAYDWFKWSNMYWAKYSEYTKDAKKLYIVGGEPLIIEEHAKSLQMMIDNDASKEMQLEYNTNLTNITPKMYDLWSYFKEVRIGASIDGYGTVFDYQRTPAKWSNVYKNLQKIESTKNINWKCWYAFTITPFNVFHFPEFMRWKIEESGLSLFNPVESYRPLVSYHMCHSPKHYNIKVLPDSVKQKVVAHYDWFRNYVSDSKMYSDNVRNKFIEHLNAVQKFMLSENCGAEESYTEGLSWLEQFKYLTVHLDIRRKQNVLDIVPQFAEIFTDEVVEKYTNIALERERYVDKKYAHHQ